MNDLIHLKEKKLDELKQYKYRILICSGAGCISSNCQAVKQALLKSLAQHKAKAAAKNLRLACL
jgi:NADH-quinone oxidoreductase subunit F